MSVDPITAFLNVGESVIERIWPDEAKRAEEVRKLKEISQRGDLAELDAHVKSLVGQLEINKIEAGHKSIFVAGWRPFCGWVGGLGLAYISIIEPIARFIAKVCLDYSGNFPTIHSDITLQVLFGMLGLGVMRSVDKRGGVQTDSIPKGVRANKK